MLAPGDPLPWVDGRRPGGGLFPLQAAAGHVLVLSYLGTVEEPHARRLLDEIDAARDLFDGEQALHLVVSLVPGEAAAAAARERPPGTLCLVDADRRLARALGLVQPAVGDGRPTLQATTFVVDPGLRVIAALPVRDLASHAAAVLAVARAALPTAVRPTPLQGGTAPVLLLPRVLEPELCATLVAAYDRGRPELSPVQVNLPDGRTEMRVDPGRKARRDITLQDPALLEPLEDRIRRRVYPEVNRAFQAHIRYVERLVLAAYEAGDHGWFGPHRDNQGPPSAHRKFACSLNLDAEGYEGGDVWFPEFGPQRYRAPSGGAVVFSCALLHAVDPVRSGRRVTVLPFLYDEEGRRLKEANQARR